MYTLYDRIGKKYTDIPNWYMAQRLMKESRVPLRLEKMEENTGTVVPKGQFGQAMNKSRQGKFQEAV